MEFFSSLKNAYDSIGSEISKTFDSSDFEKDPKKNKAKIDPTLEDTSTATEHGKPSEDDSSVYTTPKASKGNDFDASWGQWGQEEEAPDSRLINTVNKQSKTTESKKATPIQQEKVTPIQAVQKSLPTDRPDGDRSSKPVATSTPAKSTQGKLESLSRDDLIKYIKKQAQLLQKTKAKCEELSNQCEEIKKASVSAIPTPVETTPTDGLLEELGIVRSERDQAVRERKSLKQENTDLSERVELLTETNSKLKAFCVEHQSKEAKLTELKKENQELINRFSQEREELTTELSLLREKCGEHVQENIKLTTVVEELSQKVEGVGKGAELERHKVETALEAEQQEASRLREILKGREQELEQLAQERGTVNESCQHLTDQVVQLEQTISQLSKELEAAKNEKSPEETLDSKHSDELRLKISQLETSLQDRTAELANMEVDQVKLSEECVTLKDENESLNSQLSESSTKFQELNTEHMRLKDEIESQLHATILKLEHCQTELETAQNDKRTLESELTAAKSLQQTQSEALKATNEKLSAEMEALKQSNETLTSDNSTVAGLRDNCQQLTELNCGLKEELKKVKDELEATKSELETELESVKTTHKEEGRKLKALIVKLKREIKERESANGEEAIKKELEELKVAMDTLTTEKEQLSLKLSETGGNRESLEGELQELRAALSSHEAQASTVKQLEEDKRELLSQLVVLEEAKELMSSELASVRADLATTTSQVNTHQITIEKLQSEAVVVQEELTREQGSHSETREQLVAAQKDAQSSALMNLELEDYQRSLKSLEEAVTGKEAELESARHDNQLHLGTIEQLKKELDSRGAQHAAEAETVGKLKALLVKNKKELAEGRKRETELGEQVTELTATLESGRGQGEEYKVQLSELSAQLQSEQLSHQSEVERLQGVVRGVELRAATLQSELTTAQATLALVQGEYDSYKIRVHSVLKQKSSVAEQAEINPEIKRGYEEEIAQLKTALQDTRSQLSSTLSDHEELLSEHDTLTTRHDQLLQEAQATRERLSLRLREAESNYTRESAEHQELTGQLRREMEEMSIAFTTQITGLQQEHKKVVLGLREELHSTHSQLSRLQEEMDAKIMERVANQEPKRISRGLSLEVKPSGPPKETRTSGVGMEHSELESSYPSTPLSREDSTVSLERLLTQSEAERLSESEALLQRKLVSSDKKIEHLTELLRESEASAVRLSEQAKLLKEEIRRLERNQEREEVSNMEYLKNVVLKFLHTGDVKEKGSLVPIITKLLQLSPQEVKFVQNAIQGEGNGEGPPGVTVAPPALGGAASKLSNYIHRWTGY